LESLGPLGKREPGDAITHVEVWELFYKLNTLSVEIQQAVTE